MRLLSLLAAALAAAPTLAAQVGHAPADSPYRDYRGGTTVSPIATYMAGDGGNLQLGPHDGWLFGARADLRTSKFLQLGVEAQFGTAQRQVVDPFVPVEDRFHGFETVDVWSAFANVQTNFTGGKTWRGLAPYGGLSIGIMTAEGVERDTSGYEFGTKAVFAPHVGLRLFLGSNLHLRGQAKIAFWRISYPDSWTLFQPPPPGSQVPVPPVLTVDGLREWVLTPMFSVGFGLGF